MTHHDREFNAEDTKAFDKLPPAKQVLVRVLLNKADDLDDASDLDEAGGSFRGLGLSWGRNKAVDAANHVLHGEGTSQDPAIERLIEEITYPNRHRQDPKEVVEPPPTPCYLHMFQTPSTPAIPLSMRGHLGL